jgi:hypothetical protein
VRIEAQDMEGRYRRIIIQYGRRGHFSTTETVAITPFLVIGCVLSVWNFYVEELLELFPTFLEAKAQGPT